MHLIFTLYKFSGVHHLKMTATHNSCRMKVNYCMSAYFGGGDAGRPILTRDNCPYPRIRPLVDVRCCLFCYE